MADKKEYTFEEVAELYKQFNPNAIDGEGSRVVVAEDNVSMRSLMVKSLQRKGFEVFEAENGLIALKLIREIIPDLVLLDIQMPKVTGISILEAMRRDEKFANIPVIVVSARKGRQDILLAHKLKAAAYIVKPFKIEDLLAKIAEIMGG